MPDTSFSFNPDSIASTSDAASSALAAASDAGSKVVAASDLASSALALASDAASKVALASDAASSALALASDAGSKAVVAQSKASDASSAAAAASDLASSALAAASDAGSKATVAQSKASDASSAVVKLMRTVILKVFAEGSEVSAGDGAMYFAVPNILSGMNLVSCGAHIYSSAASNKVQIQLRNKTSAVDMLTSKMEIDVGELDTATASSAAVINTGADGVAVGEEIAVDVDAAGSSALGLEVRLTFQTP